MQRQRSSACVDLAGSPLLDLLSRSLLGLGLCSLSLTLSCAAPHDHEGPQSAAVVQATLEDAYARHLRLRIAPSHTKAFEALMKRCVEAASRAQLPAEGHWLCYREPPGRYWLLAFSAAQLEFTVPHRTGSFKGFVTEVGQAAGADVAADLQAMLAEIEYETEWELLLQRKGVWCSPQELDMSVHPVARMMERLILPAMEEAFEAALAARTAFLVEHEYPLPIEGFAIRAGAEQRAMQVVFPTDWSTFHGSQSFGAFILSLNESCQAEYAQRKAALMATMASAEYYDGSFVAELSYGAH